MLSGLGNMFELLRNAKDIQARVKAMQDEMASKRFDAETGGGAVRVTVDGKGVVLNIAITPAAQGDTELLEDLIKSAVNAAVERAHAAMRDQLSELTGGLNLPGLDNMLGGQ